MFVEPAEEPEPAEEEVPILSGVKLSETLSLLLALRTKADNDWYRVIYLHAVLIGVMVFFAGQADDYLPARLVVFGFYSFNVAVSYVALRESHEGLGHATADLRSFPLHQGGAGVQAWLGRRDYRRSLRLQLAMLTAAWLLVAWLLLAQVVMARLL